MDVNSATNGCPVHAGRDDRKSADIDRGITPFADAQVSRRFNFSREILRGKDMHQGGSTSATVVIDNPDHASFFYLNGEIHRKRRAAVASFFAPKTIAERYYPLMHETMDYLIAGFRSEGEAVLDQLTFELASNVVLEILGMRTGDRKRDMVTANRMRKILATTQTFNRKPLHLFFNVFLFGWFHNLIGAYRSIVLYKQNIEPAAKSRAVEPRDDVISHMVKQGYSPKSMIIECLTYGTAGVSTTREFIVMCMWQLFDHPDLKERYMNGTEAEQFAILEEILRLDPVAGYLYRRAAKDTELPGGVEVKEGQLMGVDLRASNTDPEVVGECPYQLDPDRAKRMKIVGPYLSFGDGQHRCPGSHLALHETRVFLDRFLRVPGLRFVSYPKVSWNLSVQGYELRGAVVACEPAAP